MSDGRLPWHREEKRRERMHTRSAVGESSSGRLAAARNTGREDQQAKSEESKKEGPGLEGKQRMRQERRSPCRRRE
jgi:hypothetical protein